LEIYEKLNNVLVQINLEVLIGHDDLEGNDLNELRVLYGIFLQVLKAG